MEVLEPDAPRHEATCATAIGATAGALLFLARVEARRAGQPGEEIVKAHHAVLLLVLAIAAFRLEATAQSPEILLYEGESYELTMLPLSEYLAAHRGGIPQSDVTSSGLWRGYIGTWAVRDRKLYLEDIRILTSAAADSNAPKSERFRSVLEEVFKQKGPIHAEWFTGRLILPAGEMVEYVHMGFASTYSAYLVITVERGETTGVKRMNLDEFQAFRRRQFELFKKTAEYAEALAGILKRENALSPEEAEDFLFQVNTGRFDSRLLDGP